MEATSLIKRQIIFNVLICLGIFFSPVTADIVVLKNGERLEGLAESIPGEADSILFRSSGGSIKIKREKIREIISEPATLGHLKIGDQYLRVGDFDSALAEYKEALELDPEFKEAGQRIKLVEDLLKGKEVEAEQKRLQEISRLVKEAEELEKSWEFEQVLSKLEGAEGLKPTEQQLQQIKKIKISALLGLGQLQLDRFNESGAAESFQEVLELEPTNELAQKLLLQVWERDPSRLNEIISAYQKILAANPEDKATIYKLANAYYDKKEWEKALNNYEKLIGEQAFSQEFIKTRLRQLLTSLHIGAAQAENYAEALRYYKKLLELLPGEDPLPLYIYEYAGRRQKISADDINALLELADYCRQNNLQEYAEKGYNEVLTREPENKKALEGLGFYASKLYEEAEYFYNNKQYFLAIKTAQKILDTYPRVVRVIEKASELIERSNNELRRLQRQKEAEAKELAQIGNEYFQRAEQFINSMRSLERRDNVRIFSDREEAKKYLRRAILAWEKALELDPELGELSTGDLRNKLNDAYQRLTVLERPVPMYFPLRRRAR